MGVKLAVAMGAKVTVLSQSLKKMEDGIRLGASEYYATSDPETFTKLEGSFDLILNTVSANLDLDAYMNLLDVDGTLVELGMPEHAMVLAPAPLVSMRRSLSGSMIGGIAETQEMLDFLRRARRAPRNRGHPTGLHQRGIRTRACQRRAVPLCHRYRVTAVDPAKRNRRRRRSAATRPRPAWRRSVGRSPDRRRDVRRP